MLQSTVLEYEYTYVHFHRKILLQNITVDKDLQCQKPVFNKHGFYAMTDCCERRRTETSALPVKHIAQGVLAIKPFFQHTEN